MVHIGDTRGDEWYSNVIALAIARRPAPLPARITNQEEMRLRFRDLPATRPDYRPVSHIPG
jgi:hypothetical protein